jgi:hypothetical protein
MIKSTAYQVCGFHTLQLVVESEPIISHIGYDPFSKSIPKNNSLVLAKVTIHSSTRDDLAPHALVQNEEEEE